MAKRGNYLAPQHQGDGHIHRLGLATQRVAANSGPAERVQDAILARLIGVKHFLPHDHVFVGVFTFGKLEERRHIVLPSLVDIFFSHAGL